MRVNPIKAPLIYPINRVILCIGISINAAEETDGIGLGVASGGWVVGAEHVVVEAGFRVVILSGEAEVHEGLVAFERECFAERLGDAVPHDALLRVRHLLRRAEVVVVDVIDLPVSQLRDGQRAEVDVLA